MSYPRNVARFLAVFLVFGSVFLVLRLRQHVQAPPAAPAAIGTPAKPAHVAHVGERGRLIDDAQNDTVSAPLIAVWCDDKGLFTPGPYLRFAVWEDGRVLFAEDFKTWGHKLKQGEISAAQLADLKKRVVETGVFSLKGNGHLVPDAEVDRLMVNFEERRQMLYWDEVETPGYGANSSPSPNYRAFKKCWKALNQLLRESCPPKSERVTGKFDHVPRSWYLKQPVQSE